MMLARLSKPIAVLVLVGCAFGLYKVKYQVQSLQMEAAKLERQLDKEREALHVISAEWAYLVRPTRLQELSKKYLSLEPVSSLQIADLEIVPLREENLAQTPEEAAPAEGIQPVSAKAGLR